MILLNGPVNAGEYGSAFAVSAKHLPQASPGPRPGDDPKESWFNAAVNPDAALPHAIHCNETRVVFISHQNQPGWLHPVYMVNEAVPLVFWMYPPVARFSIPAAPTRVKMLESKPIDTASLMVG